MLPNASPLLRTLWRPLCWIKGHMEFRQKLDDGGIVADWVTCRRCGADWLEPWWPERKRN